MGLFEPLATVAILRPLLRRGWSLAKAADLAGVSKAEADLLLWSKVAVPDARLQRSAP